MTQISFRGLLFDLDGTLVNSIPAVTRAWTTWSVEKGLDPDYTMSRIHGRPARDSIAELLPNSSESDLDREFLWLETFEATDTEGTVPLPGAVELLNSLEEAKVPWAIVTSGTLPVATARIKAANLPMPKVLVTPEKLTKGKPDPEPYMLGAKELGLDIHQCICFEDAKAGVLSAKNAGAGVVAILSHAQKDDLAEADYFVDSPAQLAVVLEGGKYYLHILKKGPL